MDHQGEVAVEVEVEEEEEGRQDHQEEGIRLRDLREDHRPPILMAEEGFRLTEEEVEGIPLSVGEAAEEEDHLRLDNRRLNPIELIPGVGVLT